MALQVIFFVIFFSFQDLNVYAHSFESCEKIPPLSNFLNQLSGVQKGDIRKGVNELKIYLNYLGYSNYNFQSNNKNHDHFDKSLQLTLKKYQKFYHLNITGTLDVNIIAKMQTPRCGLADFYHSKNEATHITSLYEFLGGKSKWHKKNLKYAFDKSVIEKFKQPLKHAFNQWASVSAFRFFEAKNMRKANITISFERGDHGDGYPFLETNQDLAHTFHPPINVRVHFNAYYNWSANAAKNTFDIQTVGLHEFGHALGLGHSNIEEAVMYPTIAEGERKKLHKDDIKGIKALYRYKYFLYGS